MKISEMLNRIVNVTDETINVCFHSFPSFHIENQSLFRHSTEMKEESKSASFTDMFCSLLLLSFFLTDFLISDGNIKYLSDISFPCIPHRFVLVIRLKTEIENSTSHCNRKIILTGIIDLFISFQS